MQITRSLSRSTQAFIGLIIVYLALSFILPASAATTGKYHLTAAEYRYLLFIVRLPIVAAWAIAFYSYRCLYNYTQIIKNTPEGDNFSMIQAGMRWIAWGWPIPGLIGVLLSALANWSNGFLPFALIVTNYLYVIVSLVAFNYICNSTYHLAVHDRLHLSIKHLRILVGGLVIFGVLLCVFVDHQLGNSLTRTTNPYNMPGLLVWTTIVIPYLFAWFMGILAALQLLIISSHTPGIIYRQALQFLAVGLVAVIISLCMLQYLRSIIPYPGRLSISGTLIMTYGIYAINAVGSVFLATGAQRLKRIEDI